MNGKDYYKTLGLSRGASAEEIRKAFKEQAKKYHPDRNPDNKEAEDKFKAANEAHRVLSDEKKRKLYDKAGEDWKYFYDNNLDPDEVQRKREFSGFKGNKGYSGDPSDLMGGNFSDIMEEIFGVFGTDGGARRPAKGMDYEGQVEISLEEAYRGTERVLDLGYGKIRVRLKPGIHDGKKLRIKGKGGPSQYGGKPGDLYLQVTVRQHPGFRRKGKDLYTDVTVDIYTCILGGKVRIHSLDREVELTVPAGTASDQQLRVRGLGMPEYGEKGTPGDLIVVVKVKLPTGLSAKEKALFEELRSLSKS